MGLELFFFAVVLLLGFAIYDLVVGVSNDAVNFLNSSIGSRVAPRYVILIIASLGIMAGVAFSSGMMEVARKGIFHPYLFTMPELMTIFVAVMITDIILLDLFNTYGLPTSTTVSIVFELLGGAVAVSLLKICKQGDSLMTIAQYINSSKALIIIFGILLSVVVSFAAGTIVQFLTRLLFTFNYMKKLKRYGALWGGMALAFITYFILVKGAKGATFIKAEQVDWINSHTELILLMIFGISVVLLQILLVFKVNILKPIVLIGTFALAMAFAANDLVNFIGVPMAGFHAYNIAAAADSPLTVLMSDLGKAVPTQTYMLLIAGLVMVMTLWFSRKAQTVTETELSLGRQEETEEKYESIFLSRAIVRMVIGLFGFARIITPSPLRSWMTGRLDIKQYKSETDSAKRPSFDLLRASVNMMVASAVISYATSQKLPLSTTYVTFMVAMGTSFADLAWGRESAVYRITGVLTVIAGWFVTAMLAFMICGIVATTIYFLHVIGVIILIILGGGLIWKNHTTHKEISNRKEMEQVFNLKKVTDVDDTISKTFQQMGYLLGEIRVSLDKALNALFTQNEQLLKIERIKTARIQQWANIIIANVFKANRLLQKGDAQISYKYGQTIRRLQKLADGHRDVTVRSYRHVSNQHKGLLDVQIKELQQVGGLLHEVLSDVEGVLRNADKFNYAVVVEKDRKLRELAESLNQNQMERIKNNQSKTRLSIMYYAIVGNAMMISKQNLKLLDIFTMTLTVMPKNRELAKK